MMSEETLRALIVDDEGAAREHLTQLLECHCNVKVIGEANSVANAAALRKDSFWKCPTFAMQATGR
jgi:DNA-binding NarL/FixJ family response regulator